MMALNGKKVAVTAVGYCALGMAGMNTACNVYAPAVKHRFHLTQMQCKYISDYHTVKHFNFANHSQVEMADIQRYP